MVSTERYEKHTDYTPLETDDGHATYKGETLNPGPSNRDISVMIGGSQGSGANVVNTFMIKWVYHIKYMVHRDDYPELFKDEKSKKFSVDM